MLVWAGLLAGALLVTYAYSVATTDTGQLHYHLFWLGVLLFLVPAFLRLCALDVPRAERLAIVTAIGLFNYLPKFLRTPQSPLYIDELSHWRQSEMIYRTGRLFLPNPQVYMSQYFPGLHTLTVALRDLTGLSTFAVGTILIVALHVIGLVGIFVIAERLTHAARTAAIAAFIYSLNPSFMYFDSQYSYESIAVFLVIWVIAAVMNVQDAAGDRPRQVAWFVTGLVLSLACLVTHHLSTLVLLVVLMLITVVTWVRARQGADACVNVRVTALFTLLVTLATGAWFVLVAPQVFTYLSQPVLQAYEELNRLLEHKEPARQLFAKSTTPAYEHWAAFASPVLALLGASCGLLLRRFERMHSSVGIALILFGLLYFPSLPMMLTEAGNEGARRSWAFTYVGLSLLIAPIIPWLLRRAARWPHMEKVALGGVAAILSAMLVGNVSMQTNEYYRFPGPYVYGSDTRSTTAELLETTAWFRETQGINNSLVADRYAGLAFASFGLDWMPRAGNDFPVWNLYESPSQPSHLMLNALQRSHVGYLVVDQRMSRYLPYLSIYFSNEPDALIRQTPVPAAAINKFEKLPWTIKVYQSDNFSIYRFNFTALHVPWTPVAGTQDRQTSKPVPVVTLPQCCILLTPPSIDFGPQRVNTTSAEQTILLVNLGPDPLRIATVTITGRDRRSFAAVSTCTSATIGATSGCVIKVRFTPHRAGTLGANLAIKGHAAADRWSVPLNGHG